MVVGEGLFLGSLLQLVHALGKKVAFGLGEPLGVVEGLGEEKVAGRNEAQPMADLGDEAEMPYWEEEASYLDLARCSLQAWQE